MKLTCRAFLRLSSVSAILPLASRSAWSQAYPARPMRVLVGYACAYSKLQEAGKA